LCELEVELKRGDRAVADSFARNLAERFALRELNDSKFKRARMLMG
jgi:inorganic triphosphatase YgiF